MVDKAPDADDKDSINIAAAAINNEIMRPEYRRAYQDITLKDRDLLNKIEAKSGKFSRTISVAGKKYIKERKWNKQSAKSGAITTIIWFVNFIGGNTELSSINEKHVYSSANWMEDELGLANKSDKSFTYYVYGVFAWLKYSKHIKSHYLSISRSFEVLQIRMIKPLQSPSRAFPPSLSQLS